MMTSERSIATCFLTRTRILFFGVMGFLFGPVAVEAGMIPSSPDSIRINPLFENPALQDLALSDEELNLNYSRWSRGLLFHGTLGLTDLRDNRPSLLFTPFLKNRIRPELGAVLSADIGLINSTEYRTRILALKGELQYYPLTNTIFDDGRMHRRVDPYFFAGVGLLNYAHLRVLRPDDPLTTDAGTTISASSFWDLDNNFALQAPVGLGADVWLDPATKLTVRSSLQLTGTDRLEALAGSGNDGYWTVSIGLSFRSKVPPKLRPLPPILPEPLPIPEPEMEELLAGISIAPKPLQEPAIFLPDNILFDLELYSIRPGYEMNLEEASQFLTRNPNRSMLVRGHTDASGSQRLNDMLGYKRAWATKIQLIENGISPERVFVEGRSENEPVASNKTSEDRRLNRRDEFLVVEQRDLETYLEVLPTVSLLAELDGRAGLIDDADQTGRSIENYPALSLPDPGNSFNHRGIWFPTQTANLPESSYGTIIGLYKALSENPQMKIVLVGRSEGLPNRERINRLTGESRASRIMEILVNSGIDYNRIRVFSELDYEVADPFRGDILVIRTR
jgi:outer membrane protein OmpA-like peptidoglycan-associated protein